MKLHHIGKVVPDLQQALKYYENMFGLKSMGQAVVDPIQKVEVVFVELGFGEDLTIELIRPVDESSPVYEFLKNGGGLHHLCFEVEDVEKSIETLSKKGTIVLGKPVPGKGHDDRLTAWLYTSEKELLELIEKKGQ